MMNDLQIPYHDGAAITCVESVMHYLKPTHLVYLGDVFDFSGLTLKFQRDPAQRYQLRQELDMGEQMFWYHRSIVPNAHKVYVEGNHEARLRRYVVSLADELTAFTESNGVLSLPKLLHLDQIGVEYIGPYGASWEHNSFVFKHGDSIVQYAAAKELAVEGSSGMSGHTHRGGSCYRTTRSGAHAWYENFCLCHVAGFKRPPATTATSGPYNWQQGFSVVYFDGGIFNVVQVPITGGRCIFNGKVFGG